MVAATETPDLAGKQLERARGGAEWLRGEVARLQARRIEAGWRALAGATNDDGSSSSLRYANARKEKVADGMGSFEASARIRAPTPRSGAIADVWTSSPAATAAVWAAYVHSVEQENTVEHSEHG